MSIKRTAKYLAAVAAARSLGLSVAVKHTTAEQVYGELESSGMYWDSKTGKWLERAKVDPLREMDKELIRVRVTAHLDYLEPYTTRLIDAFKNEGFTVQEVSKPYPNVRDSDGAGRIYIALRDAK